jgi:hypothetical protein
MVLLFQSFMVSLFNSNSPCLNRVNVMIIIVEFTRHIHNRVIKTFH